MANTKETEQLKELCKELLNAANIVSGPPHYIVQPFLKIMTKYSKLINKLDEN